MAAKLSVLKCPHQWRNRVARGEEVPRKGSSPHVAVKDAHYRGVRELLQLSHHAQVRLDDEEPFALPDQFMQRVDGPTHPDHGHHLPSDVHGEVLHGRASVHTLVDGLIPQRPAGRKTGHEAVHGVAVVEDDLDVRRLHLQVVELREVAGLDQRPAGSVSGDEIVQALQRHSVQPPLRPPGRWQHVQMPRGHGHRGGCHAAGPGGKLGPVPGGLLS
mmetsp:Transcript_86853/g.274184  ORF Transcript_86853/g.274184 Transcript_86853/m.274184 type:complete len:216 (+) Transcript_86853:978-1625(+)